MRDYSCVMYHFIDDTPKNKYYITKDTFISQLSLMVDMGVRSYTFDDSCVNGTPNPLCLITFDDGHKSNLWAARELCKRNFKAVFYVVKDFSLNNPNYLTSEEIKGISDMGHLIGVHGRDHNWWSFKDSKILIKELQETKSWIEGITGRPVITCSAPGGVINKNDIKNICKHIPDLKFIRTSRPGSNKLGDGVLNSTCIVLDESLNDFKKIVLNDSLKILQLKCIYKVKESIKPIYFLFKKGGK